MGGVNRDVQTLREAIAQTLPGAEIEVQPGAGPGHFAIRVRSGSFQGKSLLQQQQLVYSAIKHLMGGEAPPVHAIDRLQTESM